MMKCLETEPGSAFIEWASLAWPSVSANPEVNSYVAPVELLKAVA